MTVRESISVNVGTGGGGEGKGRGREGEGKGRGGEGKGRGREGEGRVSLSTIFQRRKVGLYIDRRASSYRQIFSSLHLPSFLAVPHLAAVISI
jgi:hypothetical protein